MKLKDKIRNQELTIGSWLSFTYSPVCEMMIKSGFEWLVIDMEHTGTDFHHALQLIQIIDLAGCVPLVRVGENDSLIIKRVLDSGAHGVIVPMVNTKEEAEKAVDSVYYPPKGSRGVGLFRAQKYGIGFEEYKECVKKEIIIIVQIEHIRGVENLESILDVDGVDAFIIGPYDLSGSLKQPGNFEHPDVLKALEEVKRVLSVHNKPGGYHVVHSDHKLLLQKIEEGYRFIAYGDDMVFFAEKLRHESVFLKEQILRR